MDNVPYESVREGEGEEQQQQQESPTPMPLQQQHRSFDANNFVENSYSFSFISALLDLH